MLSHPQASGRRRERPEQVFPSERAAAFVRGYDRIEDSNDSGKETEQIACLKGLLPKAIAHPVSTEAARQLAGGFFVELSRLGIIRLQLLLRHIFRVRQFLWRRR